MQAITAHLWFDGEAVEAADFYCSMLPDSRVTGRTTLPDTPSGDTEVVAFTLAGQPFMAIRAGPLFTFNPSVSFLVSCATVEEVERLWSRLAEGGAPLMALDSYPFSQRYGWIQDRYGLSWQLLYTEEAPPPVPRITPTLLFVGAVCGRTEEAIGFYTSTFPDSEVGSILRYGPDEAPEVEGTIKHARFRLADQAFAAMDSAYDHDFAFNEAISFMVVCDTQQEIDHYWQRLSAVPEAEQCGWLKDRYGLSWQVVPAVLDEMLQTGSPDQIARVTEAFLAMDKLEIAALRRAYGGPDIPVGGQR